MKQFDSAAVVATISLGIGSGYSYYFYWRGSYGNCQHVFCIHSTRLPSSVCCLSLVVHYRIGLTDSRALRNAGSSLLEADTLERLK